MPEVLPYETPLMTDSMPKSPAAVAPTWVPWPCKSSGETNSSGMTFAAASK